MPSSPSVATIDKYTAYTMIKGHEKIMLLRRMSFLLRMLQNSTETLPVLLNNVKGRLLSTTSPEPILPPEEAGDSKTDDKPCGGQDQKIEVIDIKSEEMMDSNFWGSCPAGCSEQDVEAVTVTPGKPLQTAPIDVNPWVDEMLQTEGTTAFDDVDERKLDEIIYPDPPAEREGCYEFEGIKIWLPKKMMSPGTYRYRIDPGETNLVADDMRICKFETSINEADQNVTASFAVIKFFRPTSKHVFPKVSIALMFSQAP
uniref:Uncharacterized protein n=1 Tax=Glossina palpalis gambiensis TaxID=67801 RepID=A0A1B0C3Y6_9MUSC